MSTFTEPTEKRPATVTVVAVLVVLAAIGHFAATVIAILFALRPGEFQQFAGAPVSDWYWVTTAFLSFVLALFYVWIARGLLAGDPQAWMLVNILAIINICFAIFQIPFGTGWAELVLNGIVLILNNTNGARIWFRTSGNF